MCSLPHCIFMVCEKHAQKLPMHNGAELHQPLSESEDLQGHFYMEQVNGGTVSQFTLVSDKVKILCFSPLFPLTSPFCSGLQWDGAGAFAKETMVRGKEKGLNCVIVLE